MGRDDLSRSFVHPFRRRSPARADLTCSLQPNLPALLLTRKPYNRTFTHLSRLPVGWKLSLQNQWWGSRMCESQNKCSSLLCTPYGSKGPTAWYRLRLPLCSLHHAGTCRTTEDLQSHSLLALGLGKGLGGFGVSVLRESAAASKGSIDESSAKAGCSSPSRMISAMVKAALGLANV